MRAIVFRLPGRLLPAAGKHVGQAFLTLRGADALRWRLLCLLALIGLLVAFSPQPSHGQSVPPNVLLITVDTLRADRLGIYGNPRAMTPWMDRLAQQGAVFDLAISPEPTTNAAHASIFTGAYPVTHGVRAHMLDTLRADVTPIAEHMQSSGYTTAGIYSWMSLEAAYSGLERGFDSYDNFAVNVTAYQPPGAQRRLEASYDEVVARLSLPGLFDHQFGEDQREEDVLDGRADATSDAAIRWLYDHRQGPFFLWIHYFDPHYPYSPPPPFDTMFVERCDACLDGSMQTIDLIYQDRQFDEAEVQRLLGLYDGELAFTDREIGRLLRTLDTLGHRDDTVVVLTGDHGESFAEHGRWFHGNGLYQNAVRVPLLMRYPPAVPPGTAIRAPVSPIDIAPTVLELSRLSIPAAVEGRSLMPLVRGEDDGQSRAVISELDEYDSQLAVVWGTWKLIVDTRTGQTWLYDFESDPQELLNRAAGEPELVAQLRGMLGRWERTHR